jgi:RNA polymerase sigma-70 factor (ECF subfamily)
VTEWGSFLADEATLLDRIRQYDQAALAQVYDDYYDRIYRYVYRFVGQVAAAEDLTANVFLRLLNAVRSGNEPRTNLLAWLYRVAHNLVVDSFRRGPAAEELELTEWLEGYEPDLTHIVEQKLQLEVVRRALLDLTPAQQQVIALKFLEGLDSVEVGAILNKSEGAIDALQHRALLALRQALKPPPGAGPGLHLDEGERAGQDLPPNVAPDGPSSLIAAPVSGALSALFDWLQLLCHPLCRSAADAGNCGEEPDAATMAYASRMRSLLSAFWSLLAAATAPCAPCRGEPEVLP